MELLDLFDPDAVIIDFDGVAEAEKFEELVDAVAAVAAAAPPVLPAEASAAAENHGLQLQSLCMEKCSAAAAAALLPHLPAHSLTRLECWSRLPITAASTLCRLTSLCSLRLQVPCENSDSSAALGAADAALAPLSALQQRQLLQLATVRRGQLAQLQLPQLQE
jgi:hypothetical protein